MSGSSSSTAWVIRLISSRSIFALGPEIRAAPGAATASGSSTAVTGDRPRRLIPSRIVFTAMR